MRVKITSLTEYKVNNDEFVITKINFSSSIASNIFIPYKSFEEFKEKLLQLADNFKRFRLYIQFSDFSIAILQNTGTHISELWLHYGDSNSMAVKIIKLFNSALKSREELIEFILLLEKSFKPKSDLHEYKNEIKQFNIKTLRLFKFTQRYKMNYGKILPYIINCLVDFCVDNPETKTAKSFEGFLADEWALDDKDEFKKSISIREKDIQLMIGVHSNTVTPYWKNTEMWLKSWVDSDDVSDFMDYLNK